MTGPDVVLKTVSGVCGDNLPLRFGSAYDASIVYDGSAEELTFQTKDAAGSLIDRVALRAGINNPSLVVNDPGADMDVRIEGDNDANLLFLDASVDRVGVGTATPGSKLTVNGTFAFTTLNAAADLNSQALVNANIDSGAVDGAVIGGASAAPGTFTTLIANTVAYINDTSNANATTGLTINQGAADNEILAFKSSDVAHGMTTDTETDTFGFIKKANAASGGLGLSAYDGAAAVSFQVTAVAGADNTAKTTGAVAPILLDVWKKSGTTVGAQGLNANLLVMRSNAGAQFIFGADQGAYEDVGSVWTNYDDEDDLTLVNSLAFHTARKGNEIGTEFARWADASRKKLQALDIVHFNEDGHHFLNMTKHQMLLNGAVRQLGLKHSEVMDEVTDLRSRLALAEKKLAALPA